MDGCGKCPGDQVERRPAFRQISTLLLKVIPCNRFRHYLGRTLGVVYRSFSVTAYPPLPQIRRYSHPLLTAHCFLVLPNSTNHIHIPFPQLLDFVLADYVLPR